MTKFPLPLHYGGNNRQKIILDDAQLAWLRRYYPVTENGRIAIAMGICLETLRRIKESYGLKKSAKGKAAILKRRVSRAAKTNERNGCYDRKRGRPVSDATREGVRRRWAKVYAGECLSPLALLKARDPEGYAAMVERRGRERKECIRKEKLRMVYGLGRKTNISVVVLKAYTQSQRHRRYSALKRGYLLDVDCSEGTAGRYVIYYDDETQRSEVFERNCIADGFVFGRDE